MKPNYLTITSWQEIDGAFEWGSSRLTMTLRRHSSSIRSREIDTRMQIDAQMIPMAPKYRYQAQEATIISGEYVASNYYNASRVKNNIAHL